MVNKQEPITNYENRVKQIDVTMLRFIITPELHDQKTALSIESLIDVDDLKDLMQPFYTSTGLGVGLFGKDHQLLASVGWQKICTHFHKQHPEALRSCRESEQFFKKHFEPNKAISFKCSNGLWDVAYPIFLGDELMGSIQFGQFFFDHEPIDKQFFIKQAERYQFDQLAYIEQLKQVPILNQDKVDAYIRLFISIVEKIAKTSKL
jgi:ligand-binding sensor protein